MRKGKSAELLLDHYQDTFQNIRYHWERRNRLFIYVLLLLAVMALDTYSPGSIAKLFNGYLTKALDKSESEVILFDFKVIGSAVWFLLLSLVIGYYQRSISVDRQYRYIDQLERQICAEMGGDYITREGKAYFSKTGAYIPDEISKRPWFVRAVGPLYTIFFPLLLVVFVLYKLWKEDLQLAEATDYFNLVVGAMIIFYNFSYVLWVHWRR